jgi:hypothetical protein
MTDEIGYSTIRPLSFVSCVSDDEVLQSSPLASPCLADGSPHEVILIKGCQAAADGLNLGIERARADWTVCLHKDVVLPAGWDQQLARQLSAAARRFGPIGVAGVYGVGPAIRQDRSLVAHRVGWVLDRGRELREASELPAGVATLDE